MKSKVNDEQGFCLRAVGLNRRYPFIDHNQRNEERKINDSGPERDLRRSEGKRICHVEMGAASRRRFRSDATQSWLIKG